MNKIPDVYVPPKKEPLEKIVEKYFKKEVGKLGGITFKFSSPMQNSVPDQIAIINGRVIFCEIKRVSGKPTDNQNRIIDRIIDNGAESCIIYGHEGVDCFIKDVIAGKNIIHKIISILGLNIKRSYK